jgi:hypothetical protein
MTHNANWFTLIIFVNKKNKPALQKMIDQFQLVGFKFLFLFIFKIRAKN